MAEPVTKVSVMGSIDPRIDALYAVPDPESVQSFLVANPFLVDLLVEARPAIAQRFPGAAVFLQLLEDPETGMIGKLRVAISPGVGPGEAVLHYQELIQGWWYHHFLKAQDQLTITLQYW